MKLAISLRIAAFACVLAAPLQARQGISQNMAQCGALMDVLSLHIRSPDRKDQIQRAGLIWAEAARAQAEKEGWIAGDIVAAYGEKRVDWEARGPAFALSQEFRDWTSYCRALALRYDIDPS